MSPGDVSSGSDLLDLSPIHVRDVMLTLNLAGLDKIAALVSVDKGRSTSQGTKHLELLQEPFSIVASGKTNVQAACVDAAKEDWPNFPCGCSFPGADGFAGQCC